MKMNLVRLLLLCVFCFALGALFVAGMQRLRNRAWRVSRAAESPPLEAQVYDVRGSQPALLNSSVRVLMVGDSRIDQAQWRELLGRDDLANRGVSGDTTAGLLARFGEAFAERVDACVLQIGINDLAQGTAIAQIERNYRKLLQQIQDRQLAATVVLTSVLLTGDEMSELNPRVNELNSRLADIAAERSCVWVDLNAKLAPRGFLEPRYTTDGIHLTGEGYRVFAAALKPLLERTG